MEKNVFEMIAEYFINERLGDILMRDEEYVKLQKEMGERMEQLEMSGMDEGQYHSVEELLLLHIRSIDFYAKKAYEYGFRDCISVLMKLDLIKTL